MKSPLKTSLLFFCFNILAVSLLYIVSNSTYAKTSVSEQQSSQQASQTVMLQNFPAKTEVYFTILSNSKVLREGRKETDDNGALSINISVDVSDAQETLIYDFKIAKDGDYLDLLLRHNLKTGQILTSGKGLDQFSDINIITSNQNLRTKSDWSGAFHETSLLKSRSAADNKFEIALHGFANLGNMGQKSPAIIKVLEAPNGGLLSETPNLPPTLSPDVDGYPLSTSTAGPLKAASDKIVENYVTATLLITEQLSAVMMQQVMAIGQFFDAKMQMEVQRTHQQLKAQAVKDYHPSKQMCRVGSYVRSLATTDQRVTANKYALNDIMMTRYTNTVSSSSAIDPGTEMKSRLKQFREIYCNPKESNLGLWFVCEHDQDHKSSNSKIGDAVPNGVGAPKDKLDRINKDIDYTRTLDFPQTVDVDMVDGIDADEEQDVIALAKHLYWPNIISYGDREQLHTKRRGVLDLRRVTALKNMAHTSYTNLVALKARAEKPAAGVEPGWIYMKTLLREFGITDDEIEIMIGAEPSYWAQMDVLTKKIYQMPSFYTNLYDKPVNVERMSVTLDAIKLMQMRDYYDSKLRNEMLNSALLETELDVGGHYNGPQSVLLFR